MTHHIDTFPQHRAGKRKGKPTIAEIVNDCLKTGQRPRAIRAIIRKLYPKAQWDDVKAAVTAEIERRAADIGRQERELNSMKALFSVVEPIMREPGNKGLTTIQALKIGADRGDARAKAYLAQFESEEAKAWNRDFEAAVALDPYWEMSEDGRSATRKAGARYQTAEELVAAYRANQLGGARHD
jgi:hypothetical protein